MGRVEIENTYIDELLRGLLGFVDIFAAGFLVLMSLLYLHQGEYLIAVLLAALSAGVSYLHAKNHPARVLAIDGSSLLLRVGKRTVRLPQQEIAYVFKAVTFNFTRRFVLYVGTKEGKFLWRRRYLLLNDKDNALIGFFRSSPVPLLNDQGGLR